MKHFMIFLCGICVGAAGTLLYLRHDFQQKVSDEVEKIVQNRDKTASDSDKNAENEDKNSSNSKTSEGKNGAEDRFGEAKKAEMEAREAYLKGATDALGYTNYAGEDGNSRVYSSDFDPKTGKKPEENEAKTGEKNDIFGKFPENFDEKIDENGKMSAPLLENEKWRMRQKSGAFGDFDADFPPEDGNFEPPYGISDEEFYTKDGKFSKKTLIFYAKSGDFSDECATFCANAPLLVGEKWRIEVGKYEENVAFIRNEKIATDFEIVVENDSFGDVVKPDFGEV